MGCSNSVTKVQPTSVIMNTHSIQTLIVVKNEKSLPQVSGFPPALTPEVETNGQLPKLRAKGETNEENSREMPIIKPSIRDVHQFTIKVTVNNPETTSHNQFFHEKVSQYNPTPRKSEVDKFSNASEILTPHSVESKRRKALSHSGRNILSTVKYTRENFVNLRQKLVGESNLINPQYPAVALSLKNLADVKDSPFSPLQGAFKNPSISSRGLRGDRLHNVLLDSPDTMFKGRSTMTPARLIERVD